MLKSLYFLLLLPCLVFCFPSYSVQQASTERVDKVLVEKSKRKLHLMCGDTILKTYSVALGGSPEGHKQREGDQKTPEGQYVIDWRNPKSQFYKSLHISYPNKEDQKNAQKNKVSPGGAIFIHGLGSQFGSIGKAHSLHDWTLGCIAVTNEEIDEIWDLVKNGTVIEIVG